MSSTYPSNWKNCATCEYWSGERTPADPFGNRVAFESPMSRGRCLNRSSGWFHSDLGKQANASCPCWEKWAVLDKMR